MQQYIPIFSLIVFTGFLLWIIYPSKPCSTNSIHSHRHSLIGSLHRQCVDCGAEWYADYFEAREGGGNVLQYYRMIKPGSSDFKTKQKESAHETV